MTSLTDSQPSTREVEGASENERDLEGDSSLLTSSDINAVDDSTPEKPRIVVMAYKLCGIPLEATIIDDGENAENVQKDHFLKENPFWKTFLNFNFAIGCMVIAFLIGYFA